MSCSGFIKMKCLQVNPDLSWVKENYDSDIEEEPEYIFTDNKDRRCVRIAFYLADMEEVIRRYEIVLVDEEITAKNTGSFLYINSTGDTQWVRTESQLWPDFIAWRKTLTWNNNGKISSKWSQGAKKHDTEVVEDKKFRTALRGEPELVDYAKAFYNYNRYSPDTELLPNMENIFSGSGNYLKDLISDNPSDVTAFIYTDEEGNERVYKHFLPKGFMLCVNNQMKIIKDYEWMYKSFIADVSNDLGELDYQLEKYGKIKNPRAEVTETNSEY